MNFLHQMRMASAGIIFLAVCCLMFPTEVNAQQNRSANAVNILDAVSGEGISQVKVNSFQPRNLYAEDPHFVMLSGPGGTFELNPWWTDLDTFHFSRKGFQDTAFTVLEIRRNGYIVLMQPTEEMDISQTPRRAPEPVSMAGADLIRFKGDRLNALHFTSSMEALKWKYALRYTRSQTGGGAVYFNGFSGQEHAWVVNGMKINHGFMGNRHDMGLLLPSFDLEQIEMEEGPGSVSYGSGAMGGVLAMRTTQAVFAEKEGLYTAGAVDGIYGANGPGLSGSGTLAMKGHHFSSRTNIRVQDLQDFEAGSTGMSKYGDWGLPSNQAITENGRDLLVPVGNPLLIEGSGIRRYEIRQQLAFRHGESWQHRLEGQYFRVPGGSHPARLRLRDSLGLPRYAQYEFDLRDRIQLSWQTLYRRSCDFFDEVELQVGWQQLNENFHFRNWQDTLQRFADNELNQFSGHLQFRKATAGGNRFRYGFRFRDEYTLSRAWARDIRDDAIVLISPFRPDGGGHTREIAAYFHHRFTLAGKLHLSFGANYAYHFLQAEFNRGKELPWLPLSFELPNNGFAGFLEGMTWFRGGWQVKGKVAGGYRTLNIEDVSLVYEGNVARPIAPNPVLRPAYVFSLDGTVRRQFGGLQLQASPLFRRFLGNFGFDSTTWEGSRFVVTGGDSARIQALRNLYSPWQAGLDLSLEWQITRGLSLDSRIAYIRGWGMDGGVAHLAPLQGGVTLSYTRNALSVDWVTIWAARKRLAREEFLPAGGANDAPEAGIPGWWATSLFFSWRPVRLLTLRAGLENLTDNAYRTFGSGLFEPGRNVSLGAGVNF